MKYLGLFIFLIFKCSEAFSEVSVSCVCVTEKPGVCPSKNLRIGVCAEICSHDSDCPNDEKCCSNGCGCQCMAPYRGICYIGVWVMLLFICNRNLNICNNVKLFKLTR
uniref:WAP domain-containing protein n=1 Tax=Sinocyclocheilus grahami TaxID=75366 RepID=A0A672R6J1_SINGR